MPNPIGTTSRLAWLMGREALPTHVRLFGDIFANDRSTVTEEAFTQEELDVMKKLVEDKNYKDVQRANELTDELDKHTKMINDMYDNMLDELGDEATEYQKASIEENRNKDLADYQAKIDSYLSTANRTNINYWDYVRDGANLNKMNEGSWFDMLNPDAKQRVLNSVGRFSAEVDKEGNAIIKDTYAMDLTPSGIVDNSSYRPRDIVEAIAYAANPSYSRKVNVKIPDVDWGLPDEYWEPKEEAVDLKRTGLEPTIK